MNLSELSELVQVTAHLKNVINSAGYSKFNNQTLAALKKRLAEFDELFISEMLNYDSRNSAKMIQDAVREAREKMGTDQKYPTRAQSGIGQYLDMDQFRNAKSVEDTAVEGKVAEAKVAEEVTKPAKKEKGRKTPNALKFVNDDLETGKTVEPTEEEAVEVKEEVKAQPKAAAPSRVTQPYTEDESLAALLAAERQKVAAKKRKQA